MGNIVALWASAFWPHPSSARVPQRRHPGLLGHGRPAVNRHTRCRTGAARRDYAPCSTRRSGFSFLWQYSGSGLPPGTALAAARGKPGALLAPPAGG